MCLSLFILVTSILELFTCEICIFLEKKASFNRSYKIITENYCRVRHKNSPKHNQRFKLYFFQLNLRFGKWSQISSTHITSY